MLKLLKSNYGGAGEKVVMIILVVLMLMSVIMEYQRCHVIGQNVDEALQAATNTVGVQNMHNASKGIREGNSGAYRYDLSADNWDENITASQITEEVKQSLGLSSKGGKLELRTNRGLEYSVSKIEIDYENARFAGNNNRTLTFITSAQLEIPITIIGDALPPIKLNRKVKTSYMNKY